MLVKPVPTVKVFFDSSFRGRRLIFLCFIKVSDGAYGSQCV